MVNIFKNDTKKLPGRTPSSNIVRTPMDQIDVGGQKSHLPNQHKSEDMSISHVPNKG